MEDKECVNIEEIKQDYERFKEQYELPEFSKLNEVFDIEDLCDCETEFLLRKIRKIISEKVAGFLRFFEIILNPSNAPMFFFKLIKKLDKKDKENLTKIYGDLGNLEIEVVKLDLDYSEEKEAEFIKKIFGFFNGIKKEILEIVDKMVNSNGVCSKKESGSYFG